MTLRACAASMLLALAVMVAGQLPASGPRYVLMTAPAETVGRGQGDGRLASILRIIVEDGNGMVARGSGAWTDHGVYTAWHVVSHARTVTVYDHKGKGHQAWGWWRLGGQDTALVRLEAPLEAPALRVAREPLGADQQAEVLAYWGQGADAGLVGSAQGQVMLKVQAIPSALRDLGPDFYATTCPIAQGMSGAPLMVGDTVYGVVSHLVNGRAAYMARCDRYSAPPISPVRRKADAPAAAPPKPATPPAPACEGPT